MKKAVVNVIVILGFGGGGGEDNIIYYIEVILKDQGLLPNEKTWKSPPPTFISARRYGKRLIFSGS